MKRTIVEAWKGIPNKKDSDIKRKIFDGQFNLQLLTNKNR